jgi:hypothetical protein
MDKQNQPINDDEVRPAEPTTPADDADDTEGHSLQMAEYGRTMARERAREAEQMARESRMREDGRKAKKPGRSFFRR